MSGHSHNSTIKRQKEANDAAKGKVFSKMARAIAIAIKAGGGADPAQNYKLRIAIEQAKASNVPKSNIDRIPSRAQEEVSYDEFTYEGYGPEGVAVLVDVGATNSNKTT